MSSSMNICYGPTTSTEGTTTSPLNSTYMTQTDFAATIKDLLENFDNKFKVSLKETIADQDAIFDAKSEKQLQTLEIYIKEYSTKFSLKIYDQDNKVSSFTASHNERLKKMIFKKTQNQD